MEEVELVSEVTTSESRIVEAKKYHLRSKFNVYLDVSKLPSPRSKGAYCVHMLKLFKCVLQMVLGFGLLFVVITKVFLVHSLNFSHSVFQVSSYGCHLFAYGPSCRPPHI